MKDIKIPMYQVRLRHPVYGWQIVQVADTVEDAYAAYDAWKAKKFGVPITLTTTNPDVTQCWSHLAGRLNAAP